jgi:hypothetical protein
LFEELSGGPLPNGRYPDITLAIFPHLREFLVIDTRGTGADIEVMSTDAVFNDEYYRAVESEFGALLREGGDRPFLHLMHLPGQLDDILRGVAMNFILDRLGVDFHDEENLPEVVVFVISGPTLAIPQDQVVAGFEEMLSQRLGGADTQRWARTLADLIQRETEAFPATNDVLGESMTDESLDPYYIWQNRN